MPIYLSGLTYKKGKWTLKKFKEATDKDAKLKTEYVSMVEDILASKLPAVGIFCTSNFHEHHQFPRNFQNLLVMQ